MKIAVISSSAPFGKGESFVINEANAIAENGHDVLLVPTQLRRGSPNRFKLDSQVTLLAQASFSFKVLGVFCFYGITSPKRLLELINLIRDKNSLWNTIKNFYVLPKAIWLTKHLKEENVEHIHAHWLTTSATLAMVVSYLTGVPWSCTAHRGDIVANNILEKKFKSAAFIRFISDSGLKLAKARANIDSDKSHVLHIGVEMPELSDAPVVEQDKSKNFTVVCPANLISVKGHECLINALSKMKFGENVRLILAGDGKLRKKLESQVRKLGLNSQVIFQGHVPHSELISWYEKKQVDIVVLPSLDLGNGVHEGIPVSLMEAMAYGVPVISTRTGGIPELLEDEYSGHQFGRLVAGGDDQSLANEIDKMVQDESYRERWRKKGRERVETEFNKQKTITTLLKYIESHRVSKS